jgi:O-antigen/teichoic acid export membrane protein
MITDRAAPRRTESIFRPALALMSGRSIGFAASFLIPVVLARVLDQAAFGTYKQFFLVASTLCGVLQLGMAESLFYFLPRGPREGGRYVANAALALIVGGLAGAVAVVVGGGALSRWFGNAELGSHTAALGGYVLLVVASAALEIAMVARKRYRLAAGTYAALDVLRAIALVGPALYAPHLGWVLLGAVAFAAVRCAVAWTYLAGEFRGGMRFDWKLLRTQVAYAAPLAMAGLVDIVQSNFHQYFVAYRVDAATFAIYAVGCLQVPLVEVAHASVLNVMMVRMSEDLREGRTGSALAAWHDSTRKLALMFFPLAAFLAVTAQPLIVLLFSDRYAASVPVFVASCIGLGLPAIAVDAALRVHAQTRIIFGLNAIRLAITVALISPLVAHFGLVGAVAATVLAAAVAKTLGLARVGVLMGLSPSRLLPWRDLARILAAALAAAALTAAVRAELAADPLPSLVVAAALYGLGYAGALWILGALSEPERTAIMTRLARFAVAADGSRR